MNVYIYCVILYYIMGDHLLVESQDQAYGSITRGHADAASRIVAYNNYYGINVTDGRTSLINLLDNNKNTHWVQQTSWVLISTTDPMYIVWDNLTPVYINQFKIAPRQNYKRNYPRKWDVIATNSFDINTRTSTTWTVLASYTEDINLIDDDWDKPNGWGIYYNVRQDNPIKFRYYGIRMYDDLNDTLDSTGYFYQLVELDFLYVAEVPTPGEVFAILTPDLSVSGEVSVNNNGLTTAQLGVLNPSDRNEAYKLFNNKYVIREFFNTFQGSLLNGRKKYISTELLYVYDSFTRKSRVRLINCSAACNATSLVELESVLNITTINSDEYVYILMENENDTITIIGSSGKKLTITKNSDTLDTYTVNEKLSDGTPVGDSFNKTTASAVVYDDTYVYINNGLLVSYLTGQSYGSLIRTQSDKNTRFYSHCNTFYLNQYNDYLKAEYALDDNRNTRWGSQTMPPTDIAYLVWDNKIPAYMNQYKIKNYVAIQSPRLWDIIGSNDYNSTTRVATWTVLSSYTEKLEHLSDDSLLNINGGGIYYNFRQANPVQYRYYGIRMYDSLEDTIQAGYYGLSLTELDFLYVEEVPLISEIFAAIVPDTSEFGTFKILLPSDPPLTASKLYVLNPSDRNDAYRAYNSILILSGVFTAYGSSMNGKKKYISSSLYWLQPYFTGKTQVRIVNCSQSITDTTSVELELNPDLMELYTNDALSFYMDISGDVVNLHGETGKIITIVKTGEETYNITEKDSDGTTIVTETYGKSTGNVVIYDSMYIVLNTRGGVVILLHSSFVGDSILPTNLTTTEQNSRLFVYSPNREPDVVYGLTTNLLNTTGYSDWHSNTNSTSPIYIIWDSYTPVQIDEFSFGNTNSDNNLNFPRVWDVIGTNEFDTSLYHANTTWDIIQSFTEGETTTNTISRFATRSYTLTVRSGFYRYIGLRVNNDYSASTTRLTLQLNSIDFLTSSTGAAAAAAAEAAAAEAVVEAENLEQSAAAAAAEAATSAAEAAVAAEAAEAEAEVAVSNKIEAMDSTKPQSLIITSQSAAILAATESRKYAVIAQTASEETQNKASTSLIDISASLVILTQLQLISNKTALVNDAINNIKKLQPSLEQSKLLAESSKQDAIDAKNKADIAAQTANEAAVGVVLNETNIAIKFIDEDLTNVLNELNITNMGNTLVEIIPIPNDPYVAYNANITIDASYDELINSNKQTYLIDMVTRLYAEQLGVDPTKIIVTLRSGSIIMTVKVLKDGVTTANVPICFPAGTPVRTNQGVIAIEKLKPDKHTIRGQKIVAITRTRPLHQYLVSIEKDALCKNVPCATTQISKEHKVYYKGAMVKAKDLVEMCEGVSKIPYNGETLYNVLLKKHDKMMINNLICETLDPNNIMAKICGGKYNDAEQRKICEELNEIIKSDNVAVYKKLYASLK